MARYGLARRGMGSETPKLTPEQCLRRIYVCAKRQWGVVISEKEIMDAIERTLDIKPGEYAYLEKP
jgi:hypothetical protein